MRINFLRPLALAIAAVATLGGRHDRTRNDRRRQQPGGARPSQLHRRHLSLARYPGQASARRSGTYCAYGLLAWRAGGALCQRRAFPEDVEHRAARNSPPISPFYPDCATTYNDDTQVVAKPIRIFHGTPDDYNPVRSCKAYQERLLQAKVDIQITEYPNAAHGFDNPLGSVPPRPAANDQSVRECASAKARAAIC